MAPPRRLRARVRTRFLPGKLACQSPERVAALVMVGSLGLVPLGRTGRDALAASVSNQSERGVREKLTRVVHDRSLITDEWVVEEARINTSPGAQSSFASLAAYFRPR